MNRTAWVSLVAGLLPIVAVNLAFWLNVQAGLPGCFPYIDGCYSVSRGVRDGPGLWVFKASALPAALLMALTWRSLPEDLAGRWTRRLGMIGAAAGLGNFAGNFTAARCGWAGPRGWWCGPPSSSPPWHW